MELIKVKIERSYIERMRIYIQVEILWWEVMIYSTLLVKHMRILESGWNSVVGNDDLFKAANQTHAHLQ